MELQNAVRIVVLFSLLHGSSCLRDVRMVIPEAAERGSRVVMQCLYDLENEALYSMKWYRGDSEFCRFSPKEVPPLKIFHMKGMHIDPDGTNSKQLTIANATDAANGRFTCEVSIDVPSFQTSQVHGFMHVVDLPSADPILIGIKRYYKIGMKLKAECASPNSAPAANLSFFINNEPASSQHVWHRVDIEKSGLVTAYANINFMIQKHHFVRGKLKIRCTAIVYSIYRKSVEKCAEEERVRSTPPAPPEIHEAVIYSVHRLPEAKDPEPSRTASATRQRNTAIIFLFLPLVYR